MRIAEIFRSIQGEGRLTGTESIFVRTSGCNLRCRYCDTPYASWTPEGEDLSAAEILDRIDALRQSAPPAFLDGFTKSAPLPFAREQESSPLPTNLRSVPGEGQGVRAMQGSGFRVQDSDSRVHLSSLIPHPSSIGPHPNPLPKGEGTNVRHIVLTGGEPMLLAELIPLCDNLRTEGWHITIETSGTLYLPVACDLMSISPKLSNSIPPPEQDPQWTWRHTLNRHAPNVIRRLTAEYDYQMKFVVDCPEDCREVEEYLRAFPQIEHGRVMLMPQGVDAAVLAEKAIWIEPYCTRRGFQFCPRRQVEWFGAARGT